MPTVYGITAASLFPSVDEFLQRLSVALGKGLRLLQVRDKDMDPKQREDFASRCVRMCHDHDCQVTINGDGQLARMVCADGVHMPSASLHGPLPERPEGMVGVSCHDLDELKQGLLNLGADFAVLSPVAATLTHHNAKPLGWDGFVEMASLFDKPIYALGGLSINDVGLAIDHGACGIASMRDVWGLPAQSTRKIAK